MEREWAYPDNEFSLMPLWFWNDELRDSEILRQIDNFAGHGVMAFVIHYRVGLPRHQGFMSDELLRITRLAVDRAASLGMRVVLCDEGCYPSGSASGLVVAGNPEFRNRCFVNQDLAPGATPELQVGENLVAVAEGCGGRRMAVIDCPSGAMIRGLHYIGDGPEEETPPAADILNPAAVADFIKLVHERYYAVLGDHFGKTVIGIFMDEANARGKINRRGVAGTTGFLAHANRLLGYDFTPHLPALWHDDEPDAQRYRLEYDRAVSRRLEETFYRPVSGWCAARGIALMGHPRLATDLGLQRYFHVPGQDLVWRWVLPGEPSGLEGAESTQAKCSSSAMIHLGRRRNSNECFGAYGHGLTWNEMKSLVDWCFVRGVNMLMPHAFFYSMRGPRRNEAPPDVGPNSPWWGDYKRFADYCRRLAWLNTDSRHICGLAILGSADELPWRAAKICLEHQRDFNYLELRHLWEDAQVSHEGIELAGMRYRVFVLDGNLNIPELDRPLIGKLNSAGRLLTYSPEVEAGALELGRLVGEASALVREIDLLLEPDVDVTPAVPELRIRHVFKNAAHYYLVTNESGEAVRSVVTVRANGISSILDPWSVTEKPFHKGGEIYLAPWGSLVIRVLENSISNQGGLR